MALQTFVFVLKCLGAFPYCEVKTSDAGPEDIPEVLKVSHPENCRTGWFQDHQPNTTLFKKHKGWKLWSIFVTASYVVISGFTFVELSSSSNVGMMNRHTEYVVGTAEKWTSYASCTLALAYLLTKRSLAVDVITELQKLIQTLHVTPGYVYRDIIFRLAFVIQFEIYIPVLVFSVAVLIKHPTLISLTIIYKTVVQLLTNGFFITFFYWTIHLISGMYIDIKISLSAISSEGKDKYKETSVTGSFKTENDSAPARRSMIRSNHEEVQHLHWKTSLKIIIQNLMQLHKVHQLINDYLGIPVMLMMLTSVMHGIMSGFLLSFFGERKMSTGREMLVICFSTWSSLLILILTNIPSILLSQIDDLKRLLRSVLHREDDKLVKEAIREVLEVVDENPGFEICGMFTLGRARLVEILSFVATYLIILLQFRLTEQSDTSAGQCTNGTEEHSDTHY